MVDKVVCFFKFMKQNNNLRYRIAEIIYRAGEGHIPSAYSIVEILSVLYGHILKFDRKHPDWQKRDYFILSKGHGCAALYVILEKYGFISKQELDRKNKFDSILAGHPDSTKIPGVEASTGSLGHGIVTAMGIALGLKIKKASNKIITLIGDGESNEGTVWETALVAAHLKLGNLCVILDNNGSTAQVLSMPKIKQKWQSFNWETHEVDGHNETKLLSVLRKISFTPQGKPKIIIAHTLKGKGVSFTEGHGLWHHKIPTRDEMELFRKELIS